MKRVIVLGLMVVFLIGCQSYKRVKTIEIEEVDFESRVEFIPIQDSVNWNGLDITITPVSSPDLNDKFSSENNFDGKLDYSYYSKDVNHYVYKYTRNRTYKENTDYAFLMKGLNWLLEKEEITQEEYNRLSDQIRNNYSSESDVSFQSYKKSLRESNPLSNPYYLNGKYLNTFQIEIENSTNEYIEFNGDVLVESGELLLHPIWFEELVQQLHQNGLLNQQRLHAIMRHNLEQDLVIPPKSRIIRYFATVPLDYKNEELKISIPSNNVKFQWKVSKEQNKVEEKLIFLKLQNTWYYEGFARTSVFSSDFYIVNSSNNISFNRDMTFVHDDSLDEEFEVIAISLRGRKLFWGRNKIKALDYINIEDNKRTNAPIVLNRMRKLGKKPRGAIIR